MAAMNIHIPVGTLKFEYGSMKRRKHHYIMTFTSNAGSGCNVELLNPDAEQELLNVSHTTKYHTNC
jgi:hypothetical protein